MVRSKTDLQPTALPEGQTSSGPGNAVLPNPKNGSTTGSQQEAAQFPDGMLGVDVGASASEDLLCVPTRFDTSTNYRGENSPNTKSLVGSNAQVPDPDLINRGYTEVPGAVNTGVIADASANRSRAISPEGQQLGGNGPELDDLPKRPSFATSDSVEKFSPTSY